MSPGRGSSPEGAGAAPGGNLLLGGGVGVGGRVPGHRLLPALVRHHQARLRVLIPRGGGVVVPAAQPAR